MWQTGGLGIDLAGAINVIDVSRIPCYTWFLYPSIISEYIYIHNIIIIIPTCQKLNQFHEPEEILPRFQWL